MELREAMKASLTGIINGIKDLIEEVPAELMPDILRTGITLVGGTALLKGLDRLISGEINVPVAVATDPHTCVVKGCGFLLEDPGLLDLVKIER